MVVSALRWDTDTYGEYRTVRSRQAAPATQLQRKVVPTPAYELVLVDTGQPVRDMNSELAHG